MTVAQLQVVDWFGIEKDKGSIGLTVIDDLDWNDEQNHVLLLQEKLNTYLAFIESGDVFTRLKSEFGVEVKSGTKINLSILAKFDIPSQGVEFLRHASHIFGSLGVSLTHRIVRVPNNMTGER
ncbi:MAG: DUF6572 domain-containing protein [Kofleriaceae bacterium]